MQNKKKSKKESIERLRKVLDDIPSKDIPPEDFIVHQTMFE